MPRSPSQAHQTPQSSHLNSHFDIPASSDQLFIIALSHTNIIVRNWAIQGLRCSHSIAMCLRTHNTSSSTPPPTISSSFSVTSAMSQPSGAALPIADPPTAPPQQARTLQPQGDPAPRTRIGCLQPSRRQATRRPSPYSGALRGRVPSSGYPAPRAVPPIALAACHGPVASASL